MAIIEIDKGSGFCFGVTTAIRKAEEELGRTGHLYCLGDIVHNTAEVDRLASQGLETITHEQLEQLHDVKVLLRAHGEPPETYETARRNRIEIIDATCPVVLKLQQRIYATHHNGDQPSPQIVIYGKRGHAEVLGLVGQTQGQATVIENIDEINKIDYSRDICLYSQTTKSVQELNVVQFNSLSTSQHQSEPPARHKSIFHQSMTRKRNTACFTCSTVSVATRMNG